MPVNPDVVFVSFYFWSWFIDKLKGAASAAPQPVEKGHRKVAFFLIEEENAV